MELPSRAVITEVGPRDGLQNEAAFVPTETKVELIRRLGETGLSRIEAVSFVHPKAIPQMTDAAEVMARLPRCPGVTYVALVPNEKGAQRALEARADEVAVVVSASETHNRRNVNRSVAESLEEVRRVAARCREAGVPWSGYVSVAFGCPYEGDVDPERVLALAARMVELGASSVGLGDTTGMGNPRQVAQVVRRFRGRFPGVRLRLHFHDTRGAGLANVLVALAEGATEFDASVGGLGGCPYAPGAAGNVASEDLVHLLHEMGVETGVDLDRLLAVARFAEEVAGRPLPGKVKQAGKRSDLVALHGRAGPGRA